MVIDEGMVYVIVGQNILFTTDFKSIKGAAVGYLASFYLLDFDYSKHCEIWMNMLQNIIFKDDIVPKDIAYSFNGVLKCFKKYKAESD